LVLVLSVVAAIGVWLFGHRTERASVNALLVIAWGVVIAATLTPSPYQPFDPHVTCNFGLTIGSVPKERLANVLLFVPLGALSWLVNPRWLWVGLVVLAPFAIEATQGLVLAMNRACDVMDVAANVIGVGIGVALAVLGRRLLTSS
jgi:hypothetical protein